MRMKPTMQFWKNDPTVLKHYSFKTFSSRRLYVCTLFTDETIEYYHLKNGNTI